MRFRNRHTTLVLIAAAIGLAGCSKGPKEAAAQPVEQARSVELVQVQSRPMQDELSASGLLLPREEAAVGSDLSGYRIARVEVEQGAWVKQGQPLVQLDDSLLRSQIAQQTIATEQARKEANRISGLDNEGVLSAEQIEARRLQARAQEAALEDMKIREAHMIIRAPVSGLVLERNVRPGEIASAAAATPMFRIVRDGLVELNAEVGEGEMARLHVGDPATVTLADGEVVEGTIRLIDPQVDTQTKLGRVRVALPVRPNLRPGGFARATFTAASEAVATVPESAILYDANGASVAVVGDDNRVQMTPIKTGRRAQGHVELIQGPPAGAWVLLRGASFVLLGGRVKPVRSED